jgi:hypothetical protein
MEEVGGDKLDGFNGVLLFGIMMETVKKDGLSYANPIFDTMREERGWRSFKMQESCHQ